MTGPASPNREREEGWIAWSGGECPVDPKAVVAVIYRDSATDNTVEADSYCDVLGQNWWKDNGEPHDIIAYRIVPTPAQATSIVKGLVG